MGLLLLLPIIMILIRFAVIPYADDPGPISVRLLLYGGYLILAAYAISFVAIGYQMSKQDVGSALNAGAVCAVSFFILQFVISPVVGILALDISLSVNDFVGQIPTLFAYLAIAFSMGAGGFLLHARVKTSCK